MSDDGRGRYMSARDEWEQTMRAIQERNQDGRQDGELGEYLSQTRNFLPPEKRLTYTVEAGRSQFGDVAAELAARTTPHDRRLQQAQLARDIARQSQLAGSNVVSNPREAAQRGFRPIVERDMFGRITTRYERIIPGADIQEA